MPTAEFTIPDEKHASAVQKWKAMFQVPESGSESVVGYAQQLSILTTSLQAALTPQRIRVPFPRVRAVQSGVFLYGPPGCGKTHLVSAAAGALKLPIAVIQPAHVQGVYFGETGRSLASVFDAGMDIARERGGAILFFDELEAYGKRIANPDAVAYNMLISNLLKFFDRASAQGTGHRLAIVAASNRADACDEAILSRLGTHVHLPLPDADTRRAYLHTHFQDAQNSGQLAPGINLDELVSETERFTTRQLAQVLDAINAEFIAGEPTRRAGSLVDPADLRRALAQIRPLDHGRAGPREGPRRDVAYA